MSVIIHVFIFLFKTEQSNFPNFLSFNSNLSSQTKNAVSKDLLTKRTVLCFTGFLEQILLRAEAMFQMPYCGNEIQASGLRGCIANKMKI